MFPPQLTGRYWARRSALGREASRTQSRRDEPTGTEETVKRVLSWGTDTERDEVGTEAEEEEAWRDATRACNPATGKDWMLGREDRPL
jgi:hypothetical protein